MPGKTKNLPSPCPICGNPNGTIQLLFTGKEDVIIRIGHYSPRKREKLYRVYETPLGYTEKKGDFRKKIRTPPLSEESKRIIKRWERRWCSFRSDNVFIRGLREDRIYNTDITMAVSRRDPPSIIRLTEHGKLRLQQQICLFGWQRIQN